MIFTFEKKIVPEIDAATFYIVASIVNPKRPDQETIHLYPLGTTFEFGNPDMDPSVLYEASRDARFTIFKGPLK